MTTKRDDISAYLHNSQSNFFATKQHFLAN